MSVKYKRYLLVISAVLHVQTSFALNSNNEHLVENFDSLTNKPAVVARHFEASTAGYFQYLKEQKKPSFVSGYLEEISKQQMNDLAIDTCMQQMIGQKQLPPVCIDEAQRALNQPMNPIVASQLIYLLKKFDGYKVSPDQRAFFSKSLLGLQEVYENHLTSAAKPLTQIKGREISALFSYLATNEKLKDAVLLVDGQKITNANQYNLEDKYFQWVLVSNTYKPLVVSGTVNLMIEKMKELEPFYISDCQSDSKLPSETYLGLKINEIWRDESCSVKSKDVDWYADVKGPNSLEEPSQVKGPSILQSKWLIPAAILVVVAAGAYALKDKSVSLSF